MSAAVAVPAPGSRERNGRDACASLCIRTFLSKLNYIKKGNGGAAADELIPGLLPSFAPSVLMNDTAAGQLAGALVWLVVDLVSASPHIVRGMKLFVR